MTQDRIFITVRLLFLKEIDAISNYRNKVIRKNTAISCIIYVLKIHYGNVFWFTNLTVSQ